MRKIDISGMIEDIRKSQCMDEEIQAIMHIFMHLAKHAPLVDQATYELKDFDIPKEWGVSDFTVELTHQGTENGKEKWRGVFTNGNKHMTVIGPLQQPKE